MASESHQNQINLVFLRKTGFNCRKAEFIREKLGFSPEKLGFSEKLSFSVEKPGFSEKLSFSAKMSLFQRSQVFLPIPSDEPNFALSTKYSPDVSREFTAAPTRSNLQKTEFF